eukprot:5180679-Amphidinium_carterae.1
MGWLEWRIAGKIVRKLTANFRDSNKVLRLPTKPFELRAARHHEALLSHPLLYLEAKGWGYFTALARTASYRISSMWKHRHDRITTQGGYHLKRWPGSNTIDLGLLNKRRLVALKLT